MAAAVADKISGPDAFTSLSSSLSQALSEVDRIHLAKTGKAIYRRASSYVEEESPAKKSGASEYKLKVNRRTRDGIPIELYRRGVYGTRSYEFEKENKDVETAKRGITKKWTEEQDAALKRAVEKYEGKNWKAIASEVEGRTHVQCLQRWKKVIRPGLIKGHWTKEEDDTLLRLMADNAKVGGWCDIAAHIPGRTPKQCRERWCLNLNPNINKGPWTPEEDKMLMDYHARLGNKWAEIASRLNNRTENAVKSRYKSLVRAKQKLWTLDEDIDIIYCKRALKYRWGTIAKRMENRTKNAIKLRWRYLVSLQPSLEETVMSTRDEAKRVGLSLKSRASRTTPRTEKLSPSIKTEARPLRVPSRVSTIPKLEASSALSLIDGLSFFDEVHPMPSTETSSNSMLTSGTNTRGFYDYQNEPYSNSMSRNNSLSLGRIESFDTMAHRLLKTESSDKSLRRQPSNLLPDPMSFESQEKMYLGSDAVEDAMQVISSWKTQSWKSDKSLLI